MPAVAGGASGGRRILASVYQLLAFCADFGMSPEEAQCHAFIKLGGVAQTQELHREQRGLLAVEAVVRRERHRTPDVRRAGVFADTGCPVGLMDTRMAGRAG